jgi:hypothetical protein
MCIKQNNDSTILAVPTDIQPGLLANIAKGTTATTTQHRNANIKKFHTNAKNNVFRLINIFARWQDKNKAWWSLMITTACFQTNNLATPLIINDTTTFNVFNNVPVDQESSTYKTDQHSEQQQRAQSFAGWDKKEQTKSGKVATRNTSVLRFTNLRTALANTALTFQFMETDMINSAVTRLSIISDSAKKLMRALHTDEAQSWIDNMNHYPHIPFHILCRFGTGIAMIAAWATDPQRNTNFQNGVKPLDNDKILRNAERHFEDIVHDINKAVDNTNAGNFGTNPTPL